MKKKLSRQYLSDMSEQGWRFVEVDAEDPDPIYYRRKLIFESLESKRLYYGIGALDEDDYEKRNEFISKCERDGWRFVSKVGKYTYSAPRAASFPQYPRI
jgi:hypothetical protein